MIRKREEGTYSKPFSWPRYEAARHWKETCHSPASFSWPVRRGAARTESSNWIQTETKPKYSMCWREGVTEEEEAEAEGERNTKFRSSISMAIIQKWGRLGLDSHKSVKNPFLPFTNWTEQLAMAFPVPVCVCVSLSVSVLAKRIFQIHKLALQKNEILCAAIAFFRHISLASGFGSVRFGSRFEVFVHFSLSECTRIVCAASSCASCCALLFFFCRS